LNKEWPKHRSVKVIGKITYCDAFDYTLAD